MVMTDIANEPDDQMSLVRFLVYANRLRCRRSDRHDLDVDEAQGAARTSSERSSMRTARCSRTCEARRGFPSVESLRAVIVEGQSAYGMAAVGPDKMSAGADLILQRARSDRIPGPCGCLRGAGPTRWRRHC